MAFRILDQAAQYRKADGTLNSGGSLNYFENNSTTPKNVTNGSGGASLGAVVTLGADARPETNKDPWGTGIYRIVLKDSAGATIDTKDNVQDGTTGGLVPLNPASGTAGQAYLTDGVAAYWASLLTVPSPTGHSGKYLGNNGETSSWTAFPATVVYSATSLPGGVVQGATSFQIGKLLVQFGSGTAPIAVAEFTSVAATFPTAYATLLHVDCTPTGSAGYTGRGTGVTKQVNGSTSGFTVRFFAGAEHGASDFNIITAVTFTWVAYGLVA